METLKAESTIDILKKVSIFGDLKDSQEALEVVAKIMRLKSYSAKHVLIEQGKEGHEFFVLVTGTVSVIKATPEGDAYKVAVLKDTHHPSFGEGGLMEGEVRSASIICDTDTKCLALSREDFNQFCKNSPQFALPVFRRISQGLMNRLNQTSNDLMLLHKALMREIRSS